jgi:cytochrome d ubiquinol oxidase subunit II
MESLWFCIIFAMLAIYAVLDGFDLGAGVIQLFLTRTERERRSVLAAAGPFWDGNEIWLLLAAGAVYCGFPAVFRSSEFRVAAIAAVFLLILRAISSELRNRADSAGSRRALDITFCSSGLLLALVLGAAAGCAMQGSTSGYRFPTLCGVCGVAALVLQSATWMALNSEAGLQTRCRQLASRAWWAVLCSCAAAGIAIVAVQPGILDTLLTHSWLCVFYVIGLAGLIGARLCSSINFDLGSFASASCLIAGFLASAVAGQFPSLPALPAAMHTSTTWLIPAFVLATGLNILAHRRHHIGPVLAFAPANSRAGASAGH